MKVTKEMIEERLKWPHLPEAITQFLSGMLTYFQQDTPLSEKQLIFLNSIFEKPKKKPGEKQSRKVQYWSAPLEKVESFYSEDEKRFIVEIVNRRCLGGRISQKQWEEFKEALEFNSKIKNKNDHFDLIKLKEKWNEQSKNR